MAGQSNELQLNDFGRGVKNHIFKYQAGADRFTLDERSMNELMSRCVSSTQNQTEASYHGRSHEQYSQDMQDAQEDFDKKQKYRGELSRQVHDHEVIRQEHSADTRYQRTVIDGNTRTYAEEDRRDQQERWNKQEEQYNEMMEGQQERRDSKRHHLEEEAREDVDIERQTHLMPDRDAVVVEARRQKYEDQDVANQKLHDEYLIDETDRAERNELKFQQYAQEQRDANIENDKIAAHDVEEKRRHLGNDLRQQIADKIQVKKDEKIREMAYCARADEIMVQSIERDRVKDEKKLDVNKQYQLDLQRQIEDNRMRKQREKAKDAEDTVRYNANYHSWGEDVYSGRRGHTEDENSQAPESVSTEDDIPVVEEKVDENDELDENGKLSENSHPEEQQEEIQVEVNQDLVEVAEKLHLSELSEPEARTGRRCHYNNTQSETTSFW